jgi:hypothetical protein
MRGARSVPLLREVLVFGLGGGVGVPCLYLIVWNAVERVGIERAESVLSQIMVWLEALRTMFWPPSVLLLAAASGEFVTRYLLLAVFANVVLYGAVGAVASLTMGRCAGFVALSLAAVVGLYAVNALWVQHAGSLIAAVVVVVCILTVLYWKRTRR